MKAHMIRNISRMFLNPRVVMFLFCVLTVFADEGGMGQSFDVYGSARTGIVFGSYDALGFSMETLVKSDWKPSGNVRFHAEALWTGAWGTANMYARLTEEGLLPLDQSMVPLLDFHTAFELYQAWTSLVLGPVDIIVGLQPLAWGTGYLFNPTSTVTPPEFPGDDIEAVASTSGISVSIALPLSFSIASYLVFEDRLRTKTSSVSEGSFGRLPFGVKVISRTDYIDASLSFFREVPSFLIDKYIDRIGIDAMGTVGEAGWYLEAAFEIPQNTDGAYDPGAFKFRDNVSACIGGNWTVPIIDVGLKVEYAHSGDGNSERSGYAWAELLSGRRVLLAEDYLFLMAERDLLSDWNVSVAGLINLNERGAAILGGLTWKPEQSLKLELSGVVYTGPEDGEMDGRIRLPSGAVADLTRAEGRIGLTIYF